MRYWGKNIEIDASFYGTAHGKSMLPTPAEKANLKAAGSYLQHDGDAGVFEETVQTMMRGIDSNAIGKILIEAINGSPRVLRIIPLTVKEQSLLNRTPCARGVGTPNTKGNDSVIWFEPWTRAMSMLSGGNSPYQVLVHELHHSLRLMRGKWYAAPPTGGFPNPEELYSVLIENMFLSSAGTPQAMLGAYNQNIPLGNRSAASFYKQYGNEIDVWCAENRDLTVQFERIHGIWNPISVRRAVLDFALDLNKVT